MSRRIQPRRWRLGSDGGVVPEDIEALEERRDKHARLTQRPARSFAEVLQARIQTDRPEPDDDREDAEDPSGARDPLLGLSPRQSVGLANPASGRRSGRVIVKG